MILVCGGAGYIGSHFVKLLRKKGLAHVVLDNLSKGHEKAVAGSELIRGDIRDRSLVLSICKSKNIDVVVHFAASIEVGESVADPAKYWDNNVVATHALLDAALEAGVNKIVFSSTAAVYGEPSQIPIPESHAKNPASPYGQTKWTVENLLTDYDQAYGLKSICFRYFNAAGADPEGELGEDHSPETHLIPRVIFAALGKAPEVKIFGTDYDTPDGTAIRDYVHVNDLANAHIRAIEHLRAGGDSRRYNLGHGKGLSVREIIDAVKHVSGRSFPVVETDRRAGDPARLVADSTAVREAFGWSPEYVDVNSIVEHAYRWYEQHPNGYGD